MSMLNELLDGVVPDEVLEDLTPIIKSVFEAGIKHGLKLAADAAAAAAKSEAIADAASKSSREQLEEAIEILKAMLGELVIADLISRSGAPAPKPSKAPE